MVVSRSAQFRSCHETQLYPDTDSLYLDLSERDSVESREVADGVVLDYDAAGHLVGIDIDHASTKVQLKRLVLRGMTAEIERAVA